MVSPNSFPPQGGQPEDIFSGTEGNSAVPPRGPASNTSFQRVAPNPTTRPFSPVNPGKTFPPAPNAPFHDPLGDVEKKPKKGMMIIGIILAAIVIIGGGGFGVYWYLTQTTDQSALTPVVTNQPAVNEITPLNTNPFIPTTNSTLTNTTTVTPAIDTDQDGLTDDEEITYQTNPKLADSDIDGLNDYVEIMTYKTNPNNADSDGDTFNDGMEVNNGYNPNGDGRLIEIPSTDVTTNSNTSLTNTGGL